MFPATPHLVTDADAVANPFIMPVGVLLNASIFVVSQSDTFQNVTFLGFPTIPPIIFTGSGVGTLLTTSSGNDSADVPASFLPYQMGVFFQFAPDGSSPLLRGFINTPPIVQKFGNNTTMIAIDSENSSTTNVPQVIAGITLFEG